MLLQKPFKIGKKQLLKSNESAWQNNKNSMPLNLEVKTRRKFKFVNP